MKNKKNRYVYFPAMLGAGCMMLLRVCDKANGLSVALAVAGMTALVYSVRHAEAKAEYITVAGVMTVTFAVRFYGYTGGPAADILLGLLVGLIMFALMCVECLVKKFKDCFWYTSAYPAAYFLFMYVTEAIKINMPFRMDTYLSCIPVLCQITALFGIYALDFLLAWTASALAFFIDHRVSRQSGILAAVYACTLCGIICFGVVHIAQMNAREAAKSDTVRVACATGPYYGSFSEASYPGYTIEETVASLTGVVNDAAQQDAEILLLSEEAYGVSDKNERVLIEEAGKLAAANNLHLLLAYEVVDTDDSESGKGINKLCWISDEGEVIYDYVKHCLVPFVETSAYVRGEENIAPFAVKVHGETLQVATAICYDSDFDVFMSHMGKNIDLLLLPTWDWRVIAEEHFSVARLRAISAETTLVRSAYDGWSAVIDSAGNILVRKNTNDVGYENVFVYDVPICVND